MDTKTAMRFTLLCVATLAVTGCAPPDTKTQIATAIARDAAISEADFGTIAAQPRVPSLEMLDNKTLTFFVLTLQKQADLSVEAKKEFDFLTPYTPKPSDIAIEVTRKGEPLSVIHTDRIKNIEVSVDGDDAKGIVTFLVPDLYEGSISFAARRSNSKWFITRFDLPNHGISLIRSTSGTWEMSKN